MNHCIICEAAFPDDTYLNNQGICGATICQDKSDNPSTTLIFQCDQCGDIWSSDIDDPMLLDAYLHEHPDGHISIEECEACEMKHVDTEDDEQINGADYNMFYYPTLDDPDWHAFLDKQKDPNLHILLKRVADETDNTIP